MDAHILRHSQPKYSCPNCFENFTAKSSLQRHLKTQQYISNNNASFISIKRKGTSRHHRRRRPQIQSLNTFSTIQIDPVEGKQYDLHIFFDSIKEEICEKFEHGVEEKGAIKWHMILNLT